MRSKLLLATLISVTLAGAYLPNAQGQTPAPVPNDAPAKPVPPEKENPQPAQQPANPDSTPQTPEAKPAPPPKKVYTNDNMPTAAGDFTGADFGAINDCDRNCFEQVRQLARVGTASNPNWKRDLLKALDPVRKDPEWQQYLRDLYDMRVRFCNLGQEKREELNRVADPRNVTPRELAVDDKYEVKFKQAQDSLQTLYSRQRLLLAKFAYNPYSLQFSQLQVSRIQNCPCAAPSYPVANQNDDDP
jgi:hypothetical protein